MKRKTIRVYISNPGESRAKHHSAKDCDTWDEAHAWMWALAAGRESAYAFAGQDGWISNANMMDKAPPGTLAERVLEIRRDINFCPDCFHHKPNLDGWCGHCGAGY